MLIFIDFRVGNIRMCIDPENAEVVILFIQVCKRRLGNKAVPVSFTC